MQKQMGAAEQGSVEGWFEHTVKWSIWLWCSKLSFEASVAGEKEVHRWIASLRFVYCPSGYNAAKHEATLRFAGSTNHELETSPQRLSRTLIERRLFSYSGFLPHFSRNVFCSWSFRRHLEETYSRKPSASKSSTAPVSHSSTPLRATAL